jgi:hypothetical protein
MTLRIRLGSEPCPLVSSTLGRAVKTELSRPGVAQPQRHVAPGCFNISGKGKLPATIISQAGQSVHPRQPGIVTDPTGQGGFEDD